MRKSIHSDPQILLRAFLKDARKKAGLTQQAVADQLNRPQSFVAKYEAGERRLDVIEFVAVARVLGVDPKRLMTRLITEAKL